MAIRAIYEDGYLKLLDPVDLQNGQHIEITIEQDPAREKLMADLADLLYRPETRNLEVLPEVEIKDINNPTDEELRALLGDLVIWPDPNYDDGQELEMTEAQLREVFSVGKPLSEMLLEDRGQQ